MTRRLARLAPVLVALLSPTLPARADDLPKGEAVLDQYIEATGGRAAYEKLKNRSMKGTLEITGAGLKGSIKGFEAEPNKSLQVTDLGEQGIIKEGTDGKVVWQMSALAGDQVYEGDERLDKLDDALFNAEIKYKDRFSKVECVAVEDVDGKPAYKLTLTPKVGKPFTEWYDKASHFLVKQVKMEKGPMGEFSVESYPGDYKKADGVILPHLFKAKVVGTEVIITLAEIKHNVDIPADTFDTPKEIKALMEKKDK